MRATQVRTGLAAGAAVALLVLALQGSGALDLLELRTRDMRARWTIPADGGRDDVAFIAITDESLEWMEDTNGVPWPWGYDVQTFIVRACALAKAKVLLVDLFLPHEREGFEELAAALSSGPPTYLVLPLREKPRGREQDPAERAAALARFAIEVDVDDSIEIPDPFKAVLLPHAALVKAAAGGCDVSTPRDPDAIIRRYRPFTRFEGRFYPSFALAALMEREGTRRVVVRDRVMTVGAVSVPLEADGTFGLRYYRPGEAFPVRTASRVIGGMASLEFEGKKTTFDPEDLEGKSVIYGTTAAGLADLKVTPVSRALPGMEIHAVALANILNGDLLREVPWGFSLALPALLAVGAALGVRLLPVLPGAVLAGLLFLGTAGSAVAAYAAGWGLDLVAPLAAVTLAYAASSALNFLYEGRQKRRVKSTFQRYVSPRVVDKILRRPGGVSTQGERKPLTLLFLDFQGFTSLSETLDPPELVKLVNEYHHAAEEAIFSTEGTIDKYIGDAIMAFWNDPVEQPDHARRACLSALGAQVRLRELAERMKGRGLPEMRARIGINTGVATVGDMGGGGQVNYTAMGDEVNLASRLEGVNKEFGTEIIVSGATRDAAGDAVEARELGHVRVKGRVQGVRIYEVMGERGKVDPERLDAARAFERALGLYRERRFAEAGTAFEALAGGKGRLVGAGVTGTWGSGDRAVRLYAALCRRYAENPPPGDWDGAYEMTVK